MKLSCPSCAAKYSIADEKVQDRLAKIRCRKCSATIIVDGKVDPPNVYTSDTGAAPAADYGDGGNDTGAGEYSVDFGDNDQRSMSLDDIVRAYRRGEITADMYVWAEGMSDWTPISSVPDIMDALGGGAPTAAARQAARTGAGRGSATDLFGGIDRAGSEEDVMTSAPHGQAAAGLATGARNESSVLFSLSALTASAPAATAPARSAVASDVKGDDSGLIDLKALTSTVGSQPPPGPLGLGSAPLGLGAAPLGMAAPLGGMTAPAMAVDGPLPRPQSSKTGLYIGGALVIVGALIAGAIVLKPRDVPSAAAPPPATAPVAVAATAAPTTEAKKDEPTAQPPATGTAAVADAPKETAAKVAAAPSHHAHYEGRPHSSGSSKSSESSSGSSKSSETSGSSSGSSAAFSGGSNTSASSGSSDSSGGEKKHHKKKEKSCNCSPGDLMCAMQCAAN